MPVAAISEFETVESVFNMGDVWVLYFGVIGSNLPLLLIILDELSPGCVRVTTQSIFKNFTRNDSSTIPINPLKTICLSNRLHSILEVTYLL
uniref:Uncharacterized protein n=1 Tax=Strigamia maritima TaxID=126957 RepID=T1JL61_STRMM